MATRSRTRISTLGLFTVVALTSTALIGSGPSVTAASVGAINASAAGAPAPVGVQQPALAAAFVKQINTDRVARHRSRLLVDPKLVASAQKWAATMARNNRLYHNPHLATSVTGWRFLGENVGVGPTVGSLKSAFWQSPHHRENMLDPSFTNVGVAVVDVGGTLWVAEEFSQPLRATAKRSSFATSGALQPALSPSATHTTGGTTTSAGGSGSGQGSAPRSRLNGLVERLRHTGGRLTSPIGGAIHRVRSQILT